MAVARLPLAICHLPLATRTGETMQAYIVRRLMLAIPTLLVVSLITFGLVNLMPGNVVENQLAESPSFRRADVKAIEHRLGLDRPVYERYGRWLGGVLHGDFGKSLWTSK